MSVSEGAEEDGGNGYEGDIFEGEIFLPDGIDPMQSFNILRRPQFHETQPVEEEEDDKIKDLQRSGL